MDKTKTPTAGYVAFGTDVRDVADPGKKLAEDIQGITSGDWTLLSEEEFAGLKKKRNDFLEENETDFHIRWSGAPARRK